MFSFYNGQHASPLRGERGISFGFPLPPPPSQPSPTVTHREGSSHICSQRGPSPWPWPQELGEWPPWPCPGWQHRALPSALPILPPGVRKAPHRRSITDLGLTPAQDPSPHHAALQAVVSDSTSVCVSLALGFWGSLC